MSLFNELKRRNVFKVAIAYIIMAWLVMQVADVILNNITAPGWVFHVLLLFLAIGLPFAVFFAWAFEMTPEGIKREHDSVADSMNGAPKSLKFKGLFPVIAVAVLISIVAIGWWALQQVTHDKDELEASNRADTSLISNVLGVATASGPRIAVLPFNNLSNDQEQK